MVTQEDTIFVSGMTPESTEEDIASHFGAIGIIKASIHSFNRSFVLCVECQLTNIYFVFFSHRNPQKDKRTMKPKIWLYKNKETGLSKGEATVTYDDANAAQSAISWFDKNDFNGVNIRVSLAQRQNNWQQKGGFSGGRGGTFCISCFCVQSNI